MYSGGKSIQDTFGCCEALVIEWPGPSQVLLSLGLISPADLEKFIILRTDNSIILLRDKIKSPFITSFQVQ